LALAAVSFGRNIFPYFLYPFFLHVEERIFEMAPWLEKPWLAGLYLSTPYLTMLCVDLGERRKKPKIKLTKVKEKYKCALD